MASASSAGRIRGGERGGPPAGRVGHGDQAEDQDAFLPRAEGPGVDGADDDEVPEQEGAASEGEQVRHPAAAAAAPDVAEEHEVRREEDEHSQDAELDPDLDRGV